MNPILSVIIPCYNCAETLEEAVESVFASDFITSFEIILVNDASTDNTQAIIERLARKHQEIKHFINKRNLGGGATRNIATQHAKGELIFCLDSDDMVEQSLLRKLVSFQQEKSCDGVGISASIKFKGKNVNNIAFTNHFGYVGGKIPLESLLERNGVFCPLYSTFLMTKEAFEKAGGYPTGHGFDTQGMAWRFLAAGLTAYTCPDAIYLHRIQFHESYYMRESNSGKVNYNWQDIFLEHFYLFDKETQEFILSFDCKNFSRNIFDELRKRDHIFRDNYHKLLGSTGHQKIHPPADRVYIRRDSPYGILLRIREKFKKNKFIRPIAIYLYWLWRRILKRLTEGPCRKEYYENIKEIIKTKKIVLDIEYGGIGDWLVYSSLPRLLEKVYNIDFYISRSSFERLRNKDTARLCFDINPHFKGFVDEAPNFFYQEFESEKPLHVFITDRGGENITETLERQFGVNGRGIPEIYYRPNLLLEYKHVILIDKNMVTGERFGRKFKPEIFERVANRYKTPEDRIEYVDPRAQDLFRYVDMIYSSKHFIATFSGGASIAACFDKDFSIIWPSNVRDRSIYQFVYGRSKGNYIE